MIYWKVPLYLNQLGSLLQDYKTILFGSCKIHSSFEFWRGIFPKTLWKKRKFVQSVYKIQKEAVLEELKLILWETSYNVSLCCNELLKLQTWSCYTLCVQCRQFNTLICPLATTKENSLFLESPDQISLSLPWNIKLPRQPDYLSYWSVLSQNQTLTAG